MESIEDKDRKLFEQSKVQTLNREDLSRKGSIDVPIRQLVEIINKNNNYYTTSSCSGRVTLTEKPYDNAGIKKGNIFHLNSHGEVEGEQLSEILEKFWEKQSGSNDSESCLWLKFEPFIMHIQCFNMDSARILLNLALASGSRNSGITLGKPKKFMLAIRSTGALEVPLYCGTRFQRLSQSYYQFLCQEANRRFKDNARRLMQLEKAIIKSFDEMKQKSN